MPRGKAKQRLVGLLNSNRYLNVHTLGVITDNHTVKWLGTNSEKQNSCLWKLFSSSRFLPANSIKIPLPKVHLKFHVAEKYFLNTPTESDLFVLDTCSLHLSFFYLCEYLASSLDCKLLEGKDTVMLATLCPPIYLAHCLARSCYLKHADWIW